MTAGNGDFDFLVGIWNIHNKRRKLNSLVADPQHNKDAEWEEFPAKHRGEKYLDGKVHIEHYESTFPNGQLVQGITTRAYDKDSGQWMIGWLDNRQAPDFSALVGKFENGVGLFYQDLTAQDGTEMKVRFMWDNITEHTARWQQSFSTDGGKTWDTNWIMEFSR